MIANKHENGIYAIRESVDELMDAMVKHPSGRIVSDRSIASLMADYFDATWEITSAAFEYLADKDAKKLQELDYAVWDCFGEPTECVCDECREKAEKQEPNAPVSIANFKKKEAADIPDDIA